MYARYTALVILTCTPVAYSQQAAPPPYRLGGLQPSGPRLSLTESWGTLRFDLTNLTDTAHDARVVVFYPERPDLRFGREAWLPAHSRLTSWMTVGPAVSEGKQSTNRDLKYQLYKRTDGEFREFLPDSNERLRARANIFVKREPTTCIVTDDIAGDATAPERPDLSHPPFAAVQFARVFRLARGLSETVTAVQDRFLPPTPDAYDGTDHVILAGNRIAEDMIGLQAIRHWVQRGGTLWVMLDRVDPVSVTTILGDDCGFEVVDRTSLTSVSLVRPGEDASKITPREYDAPIDLARVRLSGNETVLYTIDGWPAAFSQPLGRGKVVFTTLGGRAWYRSRTAREKRSGFEHHPDLPVPHTELDRLAADIYPEPVTAGLKPADLEPLIAAEIGYKVVSRQRAGAILFGFVACTLIAGLGLRRVGRPESVGWLATLLAVVTAGALVGFGLAARQAVPATVSAVSVVDVAPGNQEGSAVGLAAVYRPNSGAVRVTTESGGLVQLDTTGLEGQTRQLIHTDMDERVWENMALPAGVRIGSIRGQVRLGEVTAIARFGPDGVTGTFRSSEFPNPVDSILLSPSADSFGVRLQADGGFALTPDNWLPPGEYLTDGVISDRQQRRVDVYRKYLTPMPQHLVGRTHLLAWVEPHRSLLSVEADERIQGSLLLVVPIAFNRTPPDTKVTVPLGFIPCSPVGSGKLKTESTIGVEQALRFQLPQSVLPLTIERASLILKIRAPGRTVSVHGTSEGTKRSIREVANPIDTIRIDVTDAALLKPDPEGRLRFDLHVSNTADLAKDIRAAESGWRIESLAMEVVGKTAAK